MADTRAAIEIPGYRIERRLGRGGMGDVFLAEHVRLGRKVALKVLAPQLAESERFRDRFLRESRLAASIDHPNIVPIYDADEAGGVLYIAMRHVEGSDLKTLIRVEGAMDAERALAIVAQVAEALDAAHEHGLVHRDVKPGNILVMPPPTSGGLEHVYLTDFGLTKRALSVSGFTETGQLVGTVDYAAPEQIKGDPVDGRADIYSLGCVLYECLTGSVPYPRDQEVAVLWAHVQEPPPSVRAHRRDVPRELDTVIAHAMAKDVAERTESGHALVTELRGALGLEPVRIRRRVRPRARRRNVAIAWGAAGLIAAVLAVMLIIGGGSAGSLVPGPNTVARIDSAGRAFDAVVDVGVEPSGVAFGQGAVWVVNLADQTVTRVDPTTGEVEATKSTLGTPTGIAAGEGAVWITNGFGSQSGTAQVVRVDPADDHVERAFDTPNAHAIVVAFGSIWLADPVSDRVLRYDPATRELLDQIRLDEGSGPGAISVGEGAAAGIWVANELGGTVARIDPGTGKLTMLGVAAPSAVAAAPDAVWVTSSANDTVTRIDPTTGTTVATLTLEGDGIPNAPTGIVAAPSGIWVTSGLDGVVVRIDRATNVVTDRLRVRGIADALAVAEDGSVWVTVRARH